MDAIRQQIFQPIRQSGKPVPGFMMIQRDFWRGDTSDILISQNADASPDEIPSDAKLFKALDVPPSSRLEGWKDKATGINTSAFLSLRRVEHSPRHRQLTTREEMFDWLMP